MCFEIKTEKSSEFGNIEKNFIKSESSRTRGEGFSLFEPFKFSHLEFLFQVKIPYIYVYVKNFRMEKKQMLVTSGLQSISRILNDPLFKVCCFPLALKTKSTHSSLQKYIQI